MDSKKVEVLLKKYLVNETSLEEEKELKALFGELPFSDTQEYAYFNYLNKKGNENPLGDDFDAMILGEIEAQKPKSRSRNINVWYLAASLALVLSLGILFRSTLWNEKPAMETAMVELDTYEDPEKAFEETKQALLLISAKLNGSSEYPLEFSKFETSQETLKTN